MKLREYDKRDVRSAISGHPMISVSARTDHFNLNREAVVLTGLNAGDMVTILQDEDKPADWYLRRSYTTFGFKLREIKNGNLLFVARTIAGKLIGSCFKSAEVVKMMISGEKTEDMWPIITRSGKEVMYGKKEKGENP